MQAGVTWQDASSMLQSEPQEHNISNPHACVSDRTIQSDDRMRLAAVLGLRASQSHCCCTQTTQR